MMEQMTEALAREELKRAEEGDTPMLSRAETLQLLQAWLDSDALRKDGERLTAELERKSDAIQRLWKERDELRDEAEALRQVLQPAEAGIAKLASAAQEALKCRDTFGWSLEADEALERLRAVLDDAMQTNAAKEPQ